ncbi:MAG: PHP domain-containing protein [Armatimonadota bacterium]
MLEIDFDCHIHTVRSACGEDITDAWLCEKARENLIRFAVTDHTMHLYYEREMAWAMMSDDGIDLFEQRKESGRDNILRYIDDIRSCNQPNMMVGVELDVQADGQIMLPDDLRDDLDIVVGALHYMPTIRRKAQYAEIEAEFRQQTLWLLEYGVDVLAHPYRILLQQKHPASDELVEWVVERAGEHGAALEINSHKLFQEHDMLMIRLAAERGIKLAIGTDSHNSREFAEFSYHRMIIERAGLSDEQAQGLLFRL